ncbi:hypothetical protein ACJIZ3_001986 [Penstemon smallii]|uniref:Uncharacterized protein n=1 Tax=Penstemon smallii TaxID=265156 RepID=A0ABD3U7Q9_9LAMI
MFSSILQSELIKLIVKRQFWKTRRKEKSTQNTASVSSFAHGRRKSCPHSTASFLTSQNNLLDPSFSNLNSITSLWIMQLHSCKLSLYK